jgi:hypothetical protein
MDVCSLTGRMMSGLRLSTRIHPITGWLSLLPSSHPIPPTACLTVSLPKGQRHEVTTFHVSDNRYLRPTLSTGGSDARVGRSEIHPNHPLTILVQASQLLWLVYVHGSYKCSLTLAIVSYPNASPGWSFQERFHLAASTPFAKANFGALSGRLHIRQGCTLSACFHRITATGRWVQTEGSIPPLSSQNTRLRVAIQIRRWNHNSPSRPEITFDSNY